MAKFCSVIFIQIRTFSSSILFIPHPFSKNRTNIRKYWNLENKTTDVAGIFAFSESTPHFWVKMFPKSLVSIFITNNGMLPKSDK